MERKVIDFFDNEIMPDDCVRRIENALEPQAVPTRRNVVRLRRALTAAAILVCLSVLTVSGISMGRSGGNLPLESTKLSLRNAYDLLFGLETRSREEIAAQEAESQSWTTRLLYARPTRWPLVQTREGRLYFIGCGENIDITDQCSVDQVYIYTYTDDRGFLHYIGIGGTPELWGHFEVMYDTLNTTNPNVAWAGGGGCGHWDNQADEPYGWYVQFKELTGHPWPI